MRRFVLMSMAAMLLAAAPASAEIVYDTDPVYQMEIAASFDNGTTERYVIQGDPVLIDCNFTNVGDPVSARLLLEIYSPGGALIRTKQVVRSFTEDRDRQQRGEDGREGEIRDGQRERRDPHRLQEGEVGDDVEEDGGATGKHIGGGDFPLSLAPGPE